MHAPPTVVYTSADLKRVTAPMLKHGDKAARKLFRVKYLKYAQEHANVMRGRPPSHRVPPKAVVECIDADLLLYICRYELPKRHRTKRPERADALAVHNWVMKVGASLLNAEDADGISQLKKLKCTIGGPDGVREVQQFFIQVRKLRKLHHVKITEKQIISWLSYNIRPNEVKRTIAGILRQNTKLGRRASRHIDHFHNLLKEIARTFAKSFELGLGQVQSDAVDPKKGGRASNGKQANGRQNSGKSGRDGKKRGKGGKGGRNKQNDGDPPNNANRANNGRSGAGKVPKAPPADLKCINCGGNHYVSKCPTVPKERKNWTFSQWLKAKSSDNSNSAAPKRLKAAAVTQTAESKEQPGEKDGSAEESSTGENHPRGGRSRGKKDPKKRALNSPNRPSVKTGELHGLASEADGTVEIAGVAGVYVCDGGCDRATITKSYADEIAKKGVVCQYHKNPKTATLADGSKRAIIIGYAFTNLVLKTRA